MKITDLYKQETMIMARGSGHSQKSKENIMKAAIHEFSKVGYDRARISDIVSKAGFSQRTFYIYFDSKEALYNELVYKWVTGLQVEFEIGQFESDYKSIIDKRWIGILTYMLNDPEYTRAVFHMNPFFDEEVRAPLFGKIVQMMKWEQEHELMRKSIDLRIMAESTLATITTLALRYVLNKEIDYNFIAEQIAEIQYEGIGEKHNDAKGSIAF